MKLHEVEIATADLSAFCAHLMKLAEVGPHNLARVATEQYHPWIVQLMGEKWMVFALKARDGLQCEDYVVAIVDDACGCTVRVLDGTVRHALVHLLANLALEENHS